MSYHAFISYSHAADGKLAPALQQALQRIAKPVFQARALNVFRDETSLSATPHLWNTIEGALEQSEYLILLASPLAAQSPWVEKEVNFWLENKSINTILIGLTEGEVLWDNDDNDFAWEDTNAIPKTLQGQFSMEPLYVDFRNAKTKEELSLGNPDFKKNVARLSAAIHQMPLEDLIGEDIRLHKRAITLRNMAIAALTLLLSATLGFAWYSNNQQQLAERSLGYFFKNEENQAAWAYDNTSQRFGVINRKGELQGEGFVWENPQAFAEGVSIAERDNSFWFLDRAGNTVSDAYSFVHKTNSPAMYCFDNAMNRGVGLNLKGEVFTGVEIKNVSPDDLVSSVKGIQQAPAFYVRYSLSETINFPDFDFIFPLSETEFLLNKGGVIDSAFRTINILQWPEGGRWMIYEMETKKETFLDDTYLPFYKNSSFYNIDGINRTIYDQEKEKIGFLATDLSAVFPDCEMINNFSEGRAAAKKEGKWGYINMKGEWLISPVYDSAEPFKEGVAIIEQNEKKGLIDTTRKVLLEPQFSYFGNFIKGYAQVSTGRGYPVSIEYAREGDNWGYVNHKGEIVLEPIYDYAEELLGGTATVSKKGKSYEVVLEEDGSVKLLELGFQNIFHEQNDLFLIAWNDASRKRIFNLNGEPVNPHHYSFVGDVIEEMILVCDDRRNFGFLDTNFQEVIGTQYRDAYPFSEGLARVRDFEKWAYVDRTGKIVISDKYDDARDFNNGFALVKIGQDWTYIDRLGEYQSYDSGLLSSRFQINELFYSFNSGSGIGVVSPNGEVVVSGRYDNVLDFFDRFFIVAADRHYGVVDNFGQEILPLEFDYISKLSEGWFLTQKDNVYCYYDSCFEEQLILEERYYASLFFNQVALCDGVQSSYFINKNGEKLNEIDEAYGYIYQNGFIKFQREGKYGFVNHLGEEVIPPKYDYLFDISEGIAIFNQGGTYDQNNDLWENYPPSIKAGVWGFVDSCGKERTFPEFGLIETFKNGLAEVKIGHGYSDSTAFINTEGEIVSPFFTGTEYREDNTCNSIIGVHLNYNEDRFCGFWHEAGYFILDSLAVDKSEKFQFGHGHIRKNNRSGVVNVVGEEILLPEYSELLEVGRNLYVLKQGDRVGFATLTGYGSINFSPNQVVELERYLACNYEAIGTTYTDDWLAVKQNGKWGFVHWETQSEGPDQAALRIPCQYDAVTPFIPFSDGKRYARVYVAQYDLEFWINEQGEMLVEATHGFAFGRDDLN